MLATMSGTLPGLLRSKLFERAFAFVLADGSAALKTVLAPPEELPAQKPAW